jgi:hypothetical protein
MPHAHPFPVLPRAAGENMRMRQFKALEEKEKKKDKKEKREKKVKEKKEKRSRSLSDSRKAQDRKAADKIDPHGRLKRQRSRTTDDIEPAVREAKELSRLGDLRKRSGLAGTAEGRQRSHTIDYEDHLMRQIQLEKEKVKEKEKEMERERERELKAQAKLEKEKEKAKAKGKENDFWAFWAGLSRSVQVPLIYSPVSFFVLFFFPSLYSSFNTASL